MHRNYSNEDRNEEGAAYKQAAPFGGGTATGAPFGTTAATAASSANNKAAEDFKIFLRSVLTEISSYSKDGLPPNVVRRIFNEWVTQLRGFSATNVHQSKIIQNAIRELESKYKNINDIKLRLVMFADRRWWNKISQIFLNLQKFSDRVFVRPTTIIDTPRPQYLNTAPIANTDIALDVNGHPIYDDKGNFVPAYSADQEVIIDKIIKKARTTILVAKIAQTDLSSAMTIVGLHQSSANSLLRELNRLIGMYKDSFKSMKINLGDLFRRNKDPLSGLPDKDPRRKYDDDLEEELNKELIYARVASKRNPNIIAPTEDIHGSKMFDFNPDNPNFGFRKRVPGEGNKVYELRLEIFKTYGFAKYNSELDSIKEETDKVQDAINKKNLDKVYLIPTRRIYGTTVNSYNIAAGNKGFRSKLPQESKELYEARRGLFAVYGLAYTKLTMQMHAQAMAEKDPEERQRFNTAPAYFGDLPKELQKKQTELAAYLKDGTFIEPSHVVFGSKVSDRKFRPFNPDVDFTMKVYTARAEVWDIWHGAFMDQVEYIRELQKQLKDVEAITDESLIPDEYEGTKLNAQKFREYDSVADKHNKTAYMIKRRIWFTFRGLQTALEDDIVTSDFQRLYNNTVQFVDGIFKTIDDITVKKTTFECLGANSDAKTHLAGLMNSTNELNQKFTTTAWNKSFVVINLIAGGEYQKIISAISAQCGSLGSDLNAVVLRLEGEVRVLEELMSQLDKYDKDGVNVYLKTPGNKLPANGSPDEINKFLFNFLADSVPGGNPEYGVLYALRSI